MMIPTSKKFDTLLGGGLPEGGNILFIGKTFTGVEVFPLYLAAKSLERSENVLIVTVDKPFLSVRDTLFNFTSRREEVKFIDLYSIPTQFLDFDYHDESVVLLENRKDLDTLFNVIRSTVEEYERYRVLVPVSPFLLLLNSLEVSKFFERISALVRRDRALGFYTINSGVHDERTIEIFKRLSDGALEFAERDGKHFFRVVGIPSARTNTWIELKIGRDEISIESFTISKIR